MIYGDKLGLPLLTACQLVSCRLRIDRKSTRLNSSHLGISYAVFCLKKKKKRILSVQEINPTNQSPVGSRRDSHVESVRAIQVAGSHECYAPAMTPAVRVLFTTCVRQ